MAEKCNRPSPGWECLLDKDHDGPCPAWPTKPEQMPCLYDHETDLGTECLALASDLIERAVEIDDKEMRNRFLGLAKEWIDKAKLNFNPPFPPTKSGAPAQVGLH